MRLVECGTIKGQDIVGGRIASENIYCIDSLYMSNRMSWTGEDASLAGAEKVMYIPKNDTWVHFAQVVVFDSGVLFSSTPTVNGEKLALKSEIPSVSGYIKSVGTPSWSEIGSNSWVVTSFSLSKSGSSISVSGNHIKKSLSDQRLKEYLGKLDERYADFYKMLNPIIFKFHDDIPTIKGKHFGLYANEVADALDKANIDRSGLRLVWQSEVDSEAHEDRYVSDKTWNLDYDELHALHIYMIQGQQKEIEQLKSDNFALKGEVDILKQRLGKMEEMLNVINSKIN